MARSCLLVLVVLFVSLSAHAHTGHLHVTLECNLAKAVEKGQYDFVHQLIREGKTPKAECQPGKRIEVELFKFEESVITTEEVVEKMAEVGCRPATWPALSNLGAQHPELQRKDTIVGLGSLWTHEDGSESAPTLEGDRNDRFLKLYASWIGWANDDYTHWVFAAVCGRQKKK